jgi:hypothetical protein
LRSFDEPDAGRFDERLDGCVMRKRRETAQTVMLPEPMRAQRQNVVAYCTNENQPSEPSRSG